MIAATLVLIAAAGVGLQMLALIDECLRGSRCTCSKNAVDFRCPVHGRSER